MKTLVISLFAALLVGFAFPAPAEACYGWYDCGSSYGERSYGRSSYYYERSYNDRYFDSYRPSYRYYDRDHYGYRDTVREKKLYSSYYGGWKW